MADAGMPAADRWRMLEAMGIDTYLLRAAASTPSAPDEAAFIADSEAGHEPRLVVVCANGARNEARIARLLRGMPGIFGVPASRIGWAEADSSGALAAPPAAEAYLVLGAQMARALGSQLSTAQQHAATIAVTADAADLPGDAMAKRALWQTLKPLARRLHGSAA